MSYFEDYLDQIKVLPNEVKRCFRHVKELDSRSSWMMEESNNLSQKYIMNLKKINEEKDLEQEENKSLYSKLHDLQEKCIFLSDEKMQTIDQAEHNIEFYLTEVSKQIERMKAELREKGTEPHPHIENLLTESLVYKPPLRKRQTVTRFAIDPGSRKSTIKLLDESRLNPSQEMVTGTQLDDNEDYCFCGQKKEGEMINCDNPHCKHKWFHFVCVGLTEAPPEDEPWFCPNCRANPKRLKH